MTNHDDGNASPQQDPLDPFREDSSGEYLTSNQGVRINHTDDSLKAGHRGPTLMEDFHFREKLTHFDHERIPERVVHARGSAAHGYFQPYESLADLTRAGFLQDPSTQTPVFVRFSTVVGFRGSADTVRDVRGFATKFYTDEGNFDLVANNIPVFFIQDAVKFPDLVHSIKPEPDNEMPQASAAHDTFWDFISLMPESMHMIMWVLSDRAVPRSYRMMEGFGVHTFRLVNADGKARFVKFHWKPKLGTHSIVWDEAQKLAGKDPDFNRRDLWEAIESGHYPEFELGLQVVEEEDEHRFDFDLLDPTKLIPEEEVPVRLVGKMVLNRNPEYFFAETEQVAFHPGHVVPGIDFTNDPLLQGRLFSYLDTQLIRLGGPNFAELPINRPLAPVHNNQRDGYGRQTIHRGKVSYSPNSLGEGCPMTAGWDEGAFVHYAEKVDGRKIAERSDSFKDHYSQATLFWNSMSDPEKERIVEAAHFELGKVGTVAIRERMVEHFNHIDHELAVRTARGIGVRPPASPAVPNHGKRSPALSMENTIKGMVASRKVAVLLADGYDSDQLAAVKDALEDAGGQLQVISQFGGEVEGSAGDRVTVDKSYVAAASVMFDALYIPGGQRSIDTLRGHGDARHFVNEAFRHCKPIAAVGEAVDLLEASDLAGVDLDGGPHGDVERGVLAVRDVSSDTVVNKVKNAVVSDGPRDMTDIAEEFMSLVGQHRFWNRAQKQAVPA